MIANNGFKGFGFFAGMGYGDYREDIREYMQFKNRLPKAVVAEYIKTLRFAVSSRHTIDIFTGEELGNAGIYEDGIFRFPTDFLHYYTRYNIGIPPEYEEYLINEVGLTPEG